MYKESKVLSESVIMTVLKDQPDVQQKVEKLHCHIKKTYNSTAGC